MTDAELIAELKRLDGERTQGEWEQHPEDLRGGRYYCVTFGPPEYDSIDLHAIDNGHANAAFIAFAANSMPRLLALAERAEKMREAGVADAIDAAWNASAPGSWLVVEGERVKAAIVAAIMEKQRA